MRVRATLVIVVVAGLAAMAPAACGSGDGRSGQPLDVVATTSWLADITQNVAGDRLTVESVVPLGADPHAFEPTPADLTRIATSDLLVVNGGGLEAALQSTLGEAGGEVTTVVASEGLVPRTPGPREPAAGEGGDSGSGDADSTGGVDAHYWLDPISVVTYVGTIRDALIEADPQGAGTYRANADAYIAQLRALDEEIRADVETIPPADRKLVTNHASHGYFADRYGFEVVGAVIPSMSTDAAPSARQLSDLVATIRETGVRAIFVEADENPQLAEQIAAETGVAVETGLLDHSLTGADGPAPTYLEMMRYDTSLIVDALRSP